MLGKIRVGTASWTDPGFVAEWYPRDLPATYRLRWYAEHFNLVEVNSAFYRVPDREMVRKWCEQTPDGFIFDVKLHRLLSRHSTRPELLPVELRPKAVLKRGKVELTEALERAVAKSFLKGVSPLEQAGKLGAFLLQLSPAFSPRHNALQELDTLIECFAGYTLAIELRNRGWVEDTRLAQTRKFFVDRKLVFVMVDAPEGAHFTILPNIDLVTHRRLAYLRAHGRNAEGYIRQRTVAGRFDHDYSRPELQEIAERAVKAAGSANEVHVIYNTNKADYAPRAATNFQNILRKSFPDTLPAETKRLQPSRSVYAR
jgi:uncharacterized protein YecE (DUF72 family)